jgi:hypothetical protein
MSGHVFGEPVHFHHHQSVCRRSLFISRSFEAYEKDIIISILHAFTISPHPKDGVPDTSHFISNGLVRSPKPFDFILTPRSEHIAKTILEEATEAETELKNWEW